MSWWVSAPAWAMSSLTRETWVSVWKSSGSRDLCSPSATWVFLGRSCSAHQLPRRKRRPFWCVSSARSSQLFQGTARRLAHSRRQESGRPVRPSWSVGPGCSSHADTFLLPLNAKVFAAAASARQNPQNAVCLAGTDANACTGCGCFSRHGSSVGREKADERKYW
jgi:hypothetical protein